MPGKCDEQDCHDADKHDCRSSEGGHVHPPRPFLALFGFRHEVTRKQYWAVAALALGLLLAFWSALSYGGLVDPFFLPSPSAVAQTTFLLFTEYHLVADIWASSCRILIAFGLSVIIALPLGILMSSFRGLEAALEPTIDFIRYLPVPALVPLTILWAGIGETSKILLLFIGTFFQLVLLVMDDANNVPKTYFEIGRTLGAGTGDVMRRVLLPAVMPGVYDDMRITLGWCWTYLLIGEIVAARTGLGHVIKEAQRFAKPEVVLSGVIIIGIIGIATDYTFKLGGRLLFRHRYG